MNITNLIVDSNPIIEIENNIICTEYNIDKLGEISISINDDIISYKDICNISMNCITLPLINENDKITIVYYKI